MKEMLEKCLKGFGHQAYYLDANESKKVIEQISGKVEFGVSGIKWENYPNHISISMPGLIAQQLKNKACYIMWDEYSLPILSTDLDSALNNLDIIKPLAFDFWFIGMDFDWILEFYHEGTIRFTFL